jgi:hypothetical protein
MFESGMVKDRQDSWVGLSKQVGDVDVVATGMTAWLG